MNIMVHDVKSVELRKEFLSNGGSREIVIKTSDGQEIEITLFGHTNDVAGLPKSEDYRWLEKKK